ncbi:MAG: hypothetical protein GY856_44965 [bacterium]|nr:hypothetical protein [bacterium]
MEFENDIFVSYAHIDNLALAEGDKGWISSFHRALEVRLAQLLGKQPRIWRDPKLQGNDYFADKLVERLPKVALLVSIFSPRYVKSEWCVRELMEFLKASEISGGVRIADKARVFKVVKTPIPFEEHPQEVQGLLGYDFFTVEPSSGRARELDQRSDPDAQRQYWARLDDLAQDISELLKMLETAGDAPAPVAAAEGEGEKIYLAETSFDLKEERDAIKRELMGHGHTVLPDRPLPLVGPEMEALVREQLAGCRLSIHMVGKNYGIVPEGATLSVVALQNELAIAAAELPRLVWMPPGLEAEDERQLNFIESLQTDARIQEGADLLETSLEDFKTAIHHKLHPPESASTRDEAAPSADGDELVRIYLICDQRDGEATRDLEDTLWDQGFEVIVPVFDGDEAQVRRDHEESMVSCDAALVYWGAANELWLRRKMRELQRSAGLGRTQPMLAKAVYVAPPEDPKKQRFRTREAVVIHQQGDFESASLQPFVGQLR